MNEFLFDYLTFLCIFPFMLVVLQVSVAQGHNSSGFMAIVDIYRDPLDRGRTHHQSSTYTGPENADVYPFSE
jgi:hypothetical protein